MSAIESDGLAAWTATDQLGGDQIGISGPSLYDGTAGIGLSLAEYGTRFQDERARMVAHSAVRHALEQAETVPQSARYGLYNGWAGIIYAAARTANILGGDEELERGARQLVARLAGEEFSDEFDVMGGASGTVAALSLAGGVLDGASVALARVAAERLRETAVHPPFGVGRSWCSKGFGELPLTGLSHGCAGVGWALLELWNVIGEEWLRELADAAFHYEQHLFDERRGNWPDLRYYTSWKATELLAPGFQTVWCHGAGGIGLVRLRCYELTGEAVLRCDATRAATAVKASLELPDVHTSGDIGLCHGHAGRLDLLRTLATELDDGVLLTTVEDETHHLACRLANVAGKADAMPAGAGLMLGKAGIGWFFARHIYPDLSSPLLPSPTTTTK